ncbi:hypothetical protein TL16_g05846 [Triparma laevis f. inornata]|uniref:Uncharacterized protein n=1 Tax=Triparma laevis f. inornata TaxID=1714386 RepID=A0A9W7ALN8_9STRA|nr:hypothetical protein TL16_g05846 [Triparma laevis f. inornata]
MSVLLDLLPLAFVRFLSVVFRIRKVKRQLIVLSDYVWKFDHDKVRLSDADATGRGVVRCERKKKRGGEKKIETLKGTPIPLQQITSLTTLTSHSPNLKNSESLLLKSTPKERLLKLQIAGNKIKYFSLPDNEETSIFTQTISTQKQESLKRSMKHNKYDLTSGEVRLNRMAKGMWEKKGRVEEMVEGRRGEWEGNVGSGLLSS